MSYEAIYGICKLCETVARLEFVRGTGWICAEETAHSELKHTNQP